MNPRSFIVLQGLCVTKERTITYYDTDYVMFDITTLVAYEHAMYHFTDFSKPVNGTKNPNWGKNIPVHKETISLSNGYRKEVYLCQEDHDKFIETLRNVGFFGGPENNSGQKSAKILQLVPKNKDKDND